MVSTFTEKYSNLTFITAVNTVCLGNKTRRIVAV